MALHPAGRALPRHLFQLPGALRPARALKGLAALALGLLLALPPWLGLGGAAPARAETPGVQGLALSPENQDAIKERNLAPGRRQGLSEVTRPGGVKSPAKLRMPAKASGPETPESFRQKHLLHRGAIPNQTSRDVLLNQRIQGQGPNSLQRRTAPRKPLQPGPGLAPGPGQSATQAPVPPTAPSVPAAQAPQPPQAPAMGPAPGAALDQP